MPGQQHRAITAGQIHSPFNWLVADAAGLAALAVTADDLYKVAYRLDIGASFVLVAADPVTWVQDGIASITKAQVGLGNVDNTSDANKPVSTAQQDALDLKASISDWTGVVKVPAGTSAQRVTALGRALRFNTDTGHFEGYDGTNWQSLASTQQALSFRNRLRNGSFSINQRAVSGTVTLAAGAYGHDGWKAGAGGCTYTFAASGNSTVITISAGSLMHIVEAALVEGGTYALSNQGTAQARIAINGAATSGSYAAATTASPLLSATATANQQVTVEFTTGTLDRVQLEPGTVATTFERRPLGVELARCQRHYWRITAGGGAYIPIAPMQAINTTTFQGLMQVPVTMRATPTVSFTTGGGAFNVWNSVGAASAVSALTINASPLGVAISGTSSGLLAGGATFLLGDAAGTAVVALSAEL